MKLFRSAALAAVSAGLLAGPLPAAADARPAAAKTTVVKVTAGKPSEFRFTLSTSKVAAGTVEFKVTNKGKLSHTFSIAGKTTKTIASGRSATLTVKLKKGSYTYKCIMPGHAAKGMKGVLKVT
jgi:plastocyanin